MPVFLKSSSKLPERQRISLCKNGRDKHEYHTKITTKLVSSFTELQYQRKRKLDEMN